MATGPNDFRDPKVTSTTGTGQNPMMKWIAIAIGVLVLLLLLGWLLGLFADDDVDAVAPATTEEVIEAPSQ